MIRMATGHTLTLALCLSIILRYVSTLIAGLRRILWIHGNNPAEFVVTIPVKSPP